MHFVLFTLFVFSYYGCQNLKHDLKLCKLIFFIFILCNIILIVNV